MKSSSFINKGGTAGITVIRSLAGQARGRVIFAFMALVLRESAKHMCIGSGVSDQEKKKL